MNAPTHLSHKPIVDLPNYNHYDSTYNDALALSIGYPQWAPNKKDELSAKVWRKDVNQHWSPQSEELPLHRVLDLAHLIVLLHFMPLDNYSDWLYKSPLTIPKPQVINKAELSQLYHILNQQQTYLFPRLKELRDLLNKMNL